MRHFLRWADLILYRENLLPQSPQVITSLGTVPGHFWWWLTIPWMVRKVSLHRGWIQTASPTEARDLLQLFI